MTLINEAKVLAIWNSKTGQKRTSVEGLTLEVVPKLTSDGCCELCYSVEVTVWMELSDKSTSIQVLPVSLGIANNTYLSIPQ